MIGLEIGEDVLDTYTKMKMKRAFRWIVLKIEGEKKVVVDATGEPAATFADFVAKIPKTEPRHDFALNTS